MSAAPASRPAALPLVAVVSDAPVAYAALEEALDGLAALTVLDAGDEDLVGLVASLAPEAVVVACADGGERAAELAAGVAAPVVGLSLRESSVRLYVDGVEERPRDQRASPEAVRNIVVAAVFGRKRRR